MAMVKFTVDTANKLFILKGGVVAFDVQVDLYSDAKEHWLAGGLAIGFDFPVRTVAGDTRSDGSIVEPFYFLRDGWKIRPDEANHTLAVSGNIELDAGESGQLFVPTLGGFTVLVTANTTNRGSILSGSTTWTDAEKKQLRSVLGITGDKVAAVGGQLQDILQAQKGRWELDETSNIMTIYAADGSTPLFRFVTLDKDGNPTSDPTKIVERVPV